MEKGDKRQLLDLPRSMTELVEEKIREMIVADELKLGEAINETKLAQLFNISKTPVREALIRLSLQGSLVEIKPRSGTFVFSPTSKDIDDIGAVRALLEQGALQSAMERNRDDLLASLHRNTIAQEKLQEKLREKPDVALYRSLDYEFHNTFFRHADNPSLDQAYKQVATKIYAMRCRLNFTTEFMAESIAAHARIYRMLSEDNVKDACNLLAYHINAGFTARARHLLEDLARSNC